MGIELAKAYINVTAMTQGLDSGLAEVQRKIDNSIRDIAGGAAAILASFAGFGKGFLQQGLNLAADFESTTMKMETMLGSAEETKKTMAELTDFAVKTPFTMPGILQVATGMIQFGERGKDLMKTMDMLADVSGGDAQQFQILGLVLNQVRGVGKLLTQDFRQLSTRGIISLQDLADYYKVSTEEAQKMLSSGKISFTDLKDMLQKLREEGGRYYQMSVKQSKSLKGLLSTLEDAWNILKRQMAESLIPIVKVFTGTLIKALDVAGAMSAETRALASAALTGATAFGIMGASIMGAVAASRLLGISLKAALIGSGVGILILAMGAGLGMLVKWFSQSAQAAGFLSNVVKTLGDAWAVVKETTTSFFSSVQAWITQHTEQFQRIGALVVETFWNMWDTGKVIFENIKQAASAAGEQILQALNYAFGTSFSSAEDLFNFLLDQFEWLADRVSLFSTDWELTWEYVKVTAKLAFYEVLNEAVLTFYSMKEKAMEFANDLPGMLGTAFWAIGKYWKTVWEYQIDLGWDLMKGFADKLVDLFKITVSSIKILFKSLWEGIKNKFKGGDFMEGFRKEYEKQVRALDGEINQTVQKAVVAYDKAEEKAKGGKGPFAEQIETLKKEQADILAKMEEERNKLRAQREALMPKPEKPKPEEAKKPKPQEPAPGFSFADYGLKAGRYGFAEVGNKIQDSLLKNQKGDEQQKQTGLLEAGLQKQDELIKAVKETGGKPATLTE